MAAVGAALFLMIILGAVTKSVIMPKRMRVGKMLREPRLPVELLSELRQHPEEVLR